MSAVQNDMGQFADNRGTLLSANFPNQPITMGQYVIQPGGCPRQCGRVAHSSAFFADEWGTKMPGAQDNVGAPVIRALCE